VTGVRRIMAAVAALALSTSCGDGSQEHRTDMLIIAQAWEPHTLNPLLHIDYNAYELDNLVYSMLLQQDADGRLVPDLATNVPSMANGQISSDGLRIVYHLRRNARWQDGALVTAADVTFTYAAIMNLRTAIPSRDGYDRVERIETPDPHKIVVHLKRRFSSFLSFFFAPGQGYPVLPAHLLARYASLNEVPFNTSPVGSGPYRVTRWKRGDQLELEANSAYFDGAPRIKRVVVRYVTNGTTIMNELRSREADVYFMADPVEAEFGAGNGAITVQSHPIAGVEQIFIDNQDAILRDPRIRHALALSLNIPFIAHAVGHGFFSPHGAQRGQFYWAFDPRVPDLLYDPAAADQLFDDAGWHRRADGMRFKGRRPLLVEFAYQSGRPMDSSIAVFFTQAARARGVAVTLKSYRIEQYVAPATLGGPLYAGRFQTALLSGGFADPDVSHVFGCEAVAPRGYNFSRYCNRTFDAEGRMAGSTFDPATRAKAYAVQQRILARDLPSIVMWQDREIDIIPTRLRGFAPSIMSPFYHASRWSLQPD
jgi:peptide/nickel transport system substrate-binding protein